jgi:hypothetical protein
LVPLFIYAALGSTDLVALEQQAIGQAMREVGGNKARAAQKTWDIPHAAV